jgi:hypothetical protein
VLAWDASVHRACTERDANVTDDDTGRVHTVMGDEGGHPSQDDYVNQAAAELAFAKAMGWDDWTHNEESEEGMVRGYRVAIARPASDRVRWSSRTAARSHRIQVDQEPVHLAC